jgi:hypothetical protein
MIGKIFDTKLSNRSDIMAYYIDKDGKKRDKNLYDEDNEKAYDNYLLAKAINREAKRELKRREDSSMLQKIKEWLLKEGNKELADIMQKEESRSRYVYVAENILNNIDSDKSKEYAKWLYNKAIELSEYNTEYIWIAESIYDHLGDTKWTKIVYIQAESLISDTYSAIDMAESISDRVDDTQWCERMVEKGIDYACNSEDYTYVARAKIDLFEDYDSAKEQYKKALSIADSIEDYCSVAAEVLDGDLLDDYDWADKIYKKALESSKNISDMTTVAEYVCDDNTLGDEKWAKDIYKKAYKKSSTIKEYLLVSDSMLNFVSPEFELPAIEILKECESKDMSIDNYDDMLNLLYYKIEDSEWGDKIAKKASDKVTTIEECSQLSNILSHNKEILNQTITKIVPKISNDDERELVANIAEYELEDQIWAKSIREK